MDKMTISNSNNNKIKIIIIIMGLQKSLLLLL